MTAKKTGQITFFLIKSGNMRLKKYASNFFLDFHLKCSKKEAISCFFQRAPCKQTSLAIRKCRIPFLIKFRTKSSKNPFFVFMNFLQALYERRHCTCFFRRALFKQHCLAYRDYETTLLTFRIMKLKFDACSTFVKVLCEKSYQLLLSKSTLYIALYSRQRV